MAGIPFSTINRASAWTSAAPASATVLIPCRPRTWNP